MTSKFITELDGNYKTDSDEIYILHSPLIYTSDLLKCNVVIPTAFETDFASVPRVPFIYSFFGNRAHREAVLHDYLFRTDAYPEVSFSMANKVFLEAMKSRGKGRGVRWPMYWGVCLGAYWSYHKKLVGDKL